MAYTSLQGPIDKFSGILRDAQWHISNLKLARMEVFTTQEWTNTTKWAFCFFFFWRAGHYILTGTRLLIISHILGDHVSTMLPDFVDTNPGNNELYYHRIYIYLNSFVLSLTQRLKQT